LAEVVVDADILIGLSVKGTITQDMIRSMARDPILFAMANPWPEIMPDEAHAARDDLIMGTGRSDFPNQGDQRGDEGGRHPGAGGAGAGERARGREPRLRGRTLSLRA
jgi:hypothetical protein